MLVKLNRAELQAINDEDETKSIYLDVYHNLKDEEILYRFQVWVRHHGGEKILKMTNPEKIFCLYIFDKEHEEWAIPTVEVRKLKEEGKTINFNPN